ncbi:hypothetical protein [Cedecea neteri]|uniref:Uncharacterized protein n=1 Tax=Cedecea neteri TaxID=158822 RepID=A0A291E3L5_9ENTR|nr:hypothetical protein [Cedecea neteri]ATF94489.1 hypothetical protein CO704_21515 [Cedecea neteri]
MINFSRSLVLSFLVLSAAASAETCPKIISAISQGKTLAQIEVPANVKIDVSGEKQTVNTDRTVMLFEGDSRLAVTFASGETMKMQSDVIKIKSCISDKILPQKQVHP